LFGQLLTGETNNPLLTAYAEAFILAHSEGLKQNTKTKI
jgi:hypothetical protein